MTDSAAVKTQLQMLPLWNLVWRRVLKRTDNNTVLLWLEWIETNFQLPPCSFVASMGIASNGLEYNETLFFACSTTQYAKCRKSDSTSFFNLQKKVQSLSSFVYAVNHCLTSLHFPFNSRLRRQQKSWHYLRHYCGNTLKQMHGQPFLIAIVNACTINLQGQGRIIPTAMLLA